jgi:NAD(P)-dependent dehydrogenase (short-subunit alcohol dehydrogenase family)
MSSTAGLNGMGGWTRGGLAYTASRHGVVGLMRAHANYLAEYSIRVNSVHPTAVATPLLINEAMQEFLSSDPALSRPGRNALPVAMIEPSDVANAVAWLVSDEARYVIGITLPVDAGYTNMSP